MLWRYTCRAASNSGRTISGSLSGTRTTSCPRMSYPTASSPSRRNFRNSFGVLTLRRRTARSSGSPPRRIREGTEHLAVELTRDVDRGNVVHVRLEPEVRVHGQGQLLHVDQVVDGVLRVRVFRGRDVPDDPDLADAVPPAPREDPLLDRRIAEDALLGHAGGGILPRPP